LNGSFEIGDDVQHGRIITYGMRYAGCEVRIVQYVVCGMW
jgi:hypothetical protein